MYSLIDTHIHLDAPELQGTGSALLPTARTVGISKFVIPGVRVNGWSGMLKLAESQPDVFLAPGLHPAYADQWGPSAESQLADLLPGDKVIAVGEIGLDGVFGPDLNEQESVFRAQLEIALAVKLPVLLHVRQATGRVFSILREMQIGQKIGGIWHGFSGSLQVAKDLVDSGFKLGVGPILLRDNARKLPAVVKILPGSAFVLETDYPDMTESPQTLLQVAKKVAELRGLSLEEAVQMTSYNASQILCFEELSHG